MGWDGSALLGRPSIIPHRNWKIIFVLGADEYIETLEGKIGECLFFYVKIFYNISVLYFILPGMVHGYTAVNSMQNKSILFLNGKSLKINLETL